MSKDEQLKSIIDYLEYANLVFVEPFSLISATVVESSFITGIPKETILRHINKVFKEKYGEKYIKAQAIAHKIAMGGNPNADNIMANDEQTKVRGKGVCSEFGRAYKERTGLISKDNRPLYMACRTYYDYHKDYPWNNKDKWKKICSKYNFIDNKEEKKDEV